MRIRSYRGAVPAPRAFTLIELLVVILIILLVSAVALPTVLPAIQHRQVSEAARILQAALVGARDQAIHDGTPSGIRLLPDPTFFHGTSTVTNGATVAVPLRDVAGHIAPYETLAYNRMVPIGPAPEYTEGMVTIRPHAVYPAGVVAVPALVLEAAPLDKNGLPNPPTSWYWNVRLGDRVQINNAGPWYTVCGPMHIGPQGGTDGGTQLANSELFVNVGKPGDASPLVINGVSVEYLILVNGLDDNGNGWIDEGYDGVNNNGDPSGLIDEYNVSIGGVNYDEWEVERWSGGVASGVFSVPYTIRRRPVPAANAREVALPTAMVIDATTALMQPTKPGQPVPHERSRLPVDPYSGYAEIMVNPDGSVFYNSHYGVPSSMSMASAFCHFWLAERQDVADVPLSGGVPTPIETVGLGSHYLPIARPSGADANYSLPTLKGSYSLLTLFSRSGQIATVESPPFDDPLAPRDGTNYDPGVPFYAAQQGINGGQ